MIARAQAVAALVEDEFDVVVVGGGITGAGVALDAATRGYSVALIERADYASGTSSRSSKLVHGGLRYLQNFDLGLVREALLERQLMVALAPHLVHPLPLVVPAFDGVRPERLMGMGLNLYDVMSVERDRRRRAEAWSPERHRMISGEEAMELLPALRGREPTGGYLFYDCQTDDVRLVLTVLGEAERFGAVCANRIEALGLLERDGRARGVRARDAETGAEFQIGAGHVVNATGVWADRLADGPSAGAGTAGELAAGADPSMAERGGEPTSGPGDRVPVIKPSRGAHLILRHEDLPLIGGAIVPAGEGRSIFALPWLGRTLIGTTDRDYEGELDHVSPSADDVEYLLSATNEFFGTGFGPGDLVGAYAG
ncbi:MAG TPA: glycerol-3-phosphate dehydrogenase/oxidase, partial [Solirubrobacteraceae bacterium]|nr:glycerol-3-phosphate dehydrogenase/oxidase [Solirubrobacteraceae bacterium]